jgi:pyrroloquinoline quinone (PQQ) biosynthesis protein C
MRRMPGWMPSLLRQINWGCLNSAIFTSEDDSIETFQFGRICCRQLWHFIQQLPANIAAVRDALPPQMDAARLLLTELADEERIYQNLFVKQCQLARLNPDELALETPAPSTRQLCEVMRRYCLSGDYREGILAIVTAELAATAFCRSALPLFEKYFAECGSSYTPEEIEEGLKWLHLHTKAQTKHAMWLKRMLEDLEENSTDQLPQPVETMLKAVFEFLQCPQTEMPTSKKDLSLAQNKRG